jgi:hypothetical protein
MSVIFRPPTPPSLPICPLCGPTGGVTYSWRFDRLHRPYIEARCAVADCNRWLKFCPQKEPFLSLVGPLPDAGITGG